MYHVRFSSVDDGAFSLSKRMMQLLQSRRSFPFFLAYFAFPFPLLHLQRRLQKRIKIHVSNLKGTFLLEYHELCTLFRQRKPGISFVGENSGNVPEGRILAGYYGFNANISFTFQAIKNLYASITYLRFWPFCNFFGDSVLGIVGDKFVFLKG